MKSFTRRSEQQTGSHAHPPEDWPSGAFNPDSDFFVPAELRPHYKVDPSVEAYRFGVGSSDAKNPSSELHPLDHDIAVLGLTAEAMSQAGFHPRDHHNPNAQRMVLKQLAARITPRDRDLFLHKWRLNNAAAAEANERNRRKRAAERRVELTCQVCGEYHKLTRETRFARADDPQAEGFAVLTASVCPGCMQLVRQAINEQAAEQVTANGRTRREAAADLVRSALTGG